jgi:hypothetical protein
MVTKQRRAHTAMIIERHGHDGGASYDRKVHLATIAGLFVLCKRLPGPCADRHTTDKTPAACS